MTFHIRAAAFSMCPIEKAFSRAFILGLGIVRLTAISRDIEYNCPVAL